MATDIQTEKPVFRMTPRGWHPYIKLARLDRPIGTWLLLLPCWWSITLAGGGFKSMELREWIYMGLFALGALLMRAAGCVVNDLWDRDLDGRVERTRTRPLPAGEVTVKQALAFLGVLLGVSLGILLQFNALTIQLGFLSLLLVGTYPLMKRVTWWPQLFLGFTFNWGALMGWAAVRGNFNLNEMAGTLPHAFYLAPAWLYAGGILWTLAYDTIYAHQDKEDDATIGIRSTALLFGKHSRLFVGACFMLAILCLGVGKHFGGPSPYSPVLIAFLVGHAMWQLKNWRMDDAQSCLSTFRANRDFGLLAVLLTGF